MFPHVYFPQRYFAPRYFPPAIHSESVVGALLIDGVFSGDSLTIDRVDMNRLLVNDVESVPNRLTVDFVGNQP